MASNGSATPARGKGSPLALSVLLPLAVLAVALAIAVAVLGTSGGQKAVDKESDARALSVKRAWDAVGQPSGDTALQRLGRQLGAKLTVVRGRKPSAGATNGDVRTYGFPARRGRTLRVALPVKASSDELSSAKTAAFAAGIAGAALLVLIVFGLLRSTLTRPLAGLTNAVTRFKSGDQDARAPVKGAREAREAATALNEVIARTAKLHQAVGTDTVTGLQSPERLKHSVEIEIKRAAREMIPMAFVLIDLDDFKKVNDAHGRTVGDQTLRQVADQLRGCVRATDVVGRMGGDEFGILLPKANADEAEMVLARTRAALASVEVEGFDIGVSAGYAVYPADARDATTLMQATEGALRMAKRSGAGSTRRYDPSEVSVKHTEGERHEVVALMQAPDGLAPVFQPLVSLATGRISGFEALTRFKAPPQRRPDEWFLLAQRVGLGPALEAHAIKAALSVTNRPPGTYLSLNLSPSTLAAPEVQAVLPEDLSGLVIEVTEHELAADDSILDADLKSLRERGARVAVDDAGAGYAGLQQLMRVAPDLIKLDRSLVTDVDSDPAKQALVDSFVRFGRRTGAQVVAEGIETEEEMRTLADLDVSYGQGYFLSKPAPAWPTISPWISEKLLRRSLGGALSAEDITQLPMGSDQRLAAVCARIARVTTIGELDSLAPVMAEEVGADELVLMTLRPDENALNATSGRPWLPSGGRIDLGHFPELEGVLRTGEPSQILTERGSGTTTGMGEIAMLANSGFASLLVVPAGPNAVLMAFTKDPRPWGRAPINRALVIGYQLAPVLGAVAQHAPAA
jgi:diguanylate cyclase (GGDEF)-like protein